MTFPPGKPILAMCAVALLSGAAIFSRSNSPRNDLILWTFADLHADTYRSIISEFEKQTGKSVDIQLLNSRSMAVRLESIFMSVVSGAEVPDLVELETSWVGRFFHPPVEEIGLLPLNDRLKQSGLIDRIVSERFAPWSKRGVIFGVPHDVHPVTITYRKDLFDQAGVDLEAASTWQDFHQKCLQFQNYWRQQGYPRRYAIELPQSTADYIIAILLQRGVDLVDDYDNIYFTDPRVAQTIAFYAQLVAGPNRIASESGSGPGVWTRDALEGNFCAFMTPDWRVNRIRTYAPQLTGKVRMMPLPRFDPADPPTTTWGGTMIGIPRNSAHHDDAWKLIEFLYFSQSGLKARQRVTNILPPLIQQWDDPGYHGADEFFGGQKIDEMYIELARRIPSRHVTPATTLAWIELSVILNRAVTHLKEFGEADLLAKCQAWAQQADEDIQRRIEHGKAGE